MPSGASDTPPQDVRTCTENAVRSRAARMHVDVSDLLPDVAVPTLVVAAEEGDRP